MKTMTCRELGGACDLKFHAKTFAEIGEQSKKHGMEMAQKGDAAHLDAMKNMMEKMNSPQAMKEWMQQIQKNFEALPESK